MSSACIEQDAREPIKQLEPGQRETRKVALEIRKGAEVDNKKAKEGKKELAARR